MTSNVGADLHDLAADVRAIPRPVMIAAARASKKIVVDTGKRWGGGDLRGKKKRGLKLRARDTIRDIPRGATCRVQGSIPAWVWLQSGVRPHAIRRRKKGPMRKMTVQHPGAWRGGVGAWDVARAAVEEEVPKIFAQAVAKVVRRG